MEENAPLDETGQFYTTNSDVVYPVTFLREEFCATFENMSVNDYTACMIQFQTMSINAWLSLFLGLVVGYILARGIFNWK